MPITKVMMRALPKALSTKANNISFYGNGRKRKDTKLTASELELKSSGILGRSLVKQPIISFQDTKSEIEKILYTIIGDDNNKIIKSVRPNFVPQFAEKISKNPQKNILIGICGESASGKTTICNTIRDMADNDDLSIEILSADNYFRDISKYIRQYGSFDEFLKAGIYDVDAPTNFNLEQLHEDLIELSNGNDVRIPQYLVNGTGISVPNAIPKKAEKIIVIEGLATMYSPIRELLDAQIFVDIDSKTQERRYIKRAMAERNQTETDALKQLAYVKEAANKYILPKKDVADITIDGSVAIDNFAQLLKKLAAVVKSSQE